MHHWQRVLICTAALIPVGLSLRGVVLKMPEAVRAGDSVSMSCHYDLEGAALYSVKFYQGDDEFYRFVPKESPPTRVFPRDGIQVDVMLDNAASKKKIYQSNSTVVTLRNVQRNVTGLYKCEVSADAPLFHTIIKSANIVVTEEPLALPEVSVEKGKYSLGERIRANCSSQGGVPPANLSWYINGRQMKEWGLGRETSLNPELLALEVEATAGMFRDGKLRLRCLATQYTLYRKTAEIDLQEDTPQLAHVMGPTHHTSFEVSEHNAAKRTSSRCWLVYPLLLLFWRVTR